MNENLYHRLGVAENAPVEVISAAYKALLKNHHPDHAINDKDRNDRETICKLLGEAHTILSMASSRSEYDNQLAKEQKKNNDAENQYRQQGESYNGYEKTNNRKQSNAEGHSHNGFGKRDQDNQHQEAAGFTSPSGELINRYDDLSVTARRRLDLLAFGDREWRHLRRSLLRERARLGGLPLAWFGSTNHVPATPGSRQIVGTMLGSFNATLIAASLLWATGWFRKFAEETVGELWIVPVVQVPVIALALTMLLGSVIIILWFRRYGGWFSTSRKGRVNLSIWSTGWGLIIMLAPLLLFPGIIVAIIIAAALWWSQR